MPVPFRCFGSVCAPEGSASDYQVTTLRRPDPFPALLLCPPERTRAAVHLPEAGETMRVTLAMPDPAGLSQDQPAAMFLRLAA
jgi:hypothetical protein